MTRHTVHLFASAVSAEFRSYREGLVEFISRPGCGSRNRPGSSATECRS